MVDDATQVTTPVGQPCYVCDEPVADGDRGFVRPAVRPAVRMVDGEPTAAAEPVHAECDLRLVMGHDEGVCPCTGYGSDRAAGRLVRERVFGARERADR